MRLVIRSGLALVGAAVLLTPCQMGLADGQVQASYTARLSIAKASAPVGEDVPYVVTVTPAAKAAGKRARVQVRGRRGWVGVDTFRLNRKGKVRADVEGYQAGTGRYRVLVISKAGKVVTKSSVVAVMWTIPQ